MSEKKLMLGNEAIARGAYEAGVKVSAGTGGAQSKKGQVPLNTVPDPKLVLSFSADEYFSRTYI